MRLRLAAAVIVSGTALCSTPASAQLLFGKQPVCTLQYQPVCATRGGMTRTYGNACQARADGARIVAQGECRRRGARAQSAPAEPQEPMQPQDAPSITWERDGAEPPRR
jgi:hypothetical protein